MAQNDFNSQIAQLDQGLKNLDMWEKSILNNEIAFGNPKSKLTQQEQFLLWKAEIIETGVFPDRDEFLNKMETL